MIINLNNQPIKFELIPITIRCRDISSVFYRKNNKTLKQTFENDKYSLLKLMLYEKYTDNLNDKLGDFLKTLKESNDSHYLCFLNRYGDGKFCKFEINENLKDRGIYCFMVDNQIRYVGRCTDNFNKRINHGYGKIHPKNCFIDGQATNCRINTLINSTENVNFGIHLMNEQSTDEIKELEKKILTCNRYEWNIK